MPPKKTSTYELLFSPFKPFKGRGLISFMHERLGEIWYNLVLCSEDHLPNKLPLIKAELGKFENFEVELENPSNKEAIIKVQNSNPKNYSILQEQITISPSSSIRITIRFINTT